jgi:serine/threonine protein kinase
MLISNIFQSFYFPRLKNYCKDITKYTTKAIRFFPNNFLKIKNCNYCLYDGVTSNLKKIAINDIKVSYIMQNASFNKKSIDNFSDELKKSLYNNKQLSLIFLQIYYISIVCNKNNLFHNDLKPANIVINKAKKNFSYKGLGNLVINIKKNDLIPIFIDYDLISFQNLNIDHPAEGFSEDFTFFTEKIPSKYKKNFPDIFSLPNYHVRINSNKIRKIFYLYGFLG